MDIRPMAVADAWVCQPRIHRDERGSFAEWFRGDLLREATHRRFDIVQANHSTSRRGVVRGVHFADVPPGQAKFVYCPVGAVLDVVVDVRAGSPTFGVSDAVVLDDADRRGVFIAEGLGHAFCALRDDTSVAYLVSATYDAGSEHTVSPTDPGLQLPWPDEVGSLVLSDKDAGAPGLEEALRQGLLPEYDACRKWYAAGSG